jgi:hypothetical protein
MSKRLVHVIFLVIAALSAASTSGAAAGNGADTKGVGGGWVTNFVPGTSKYAHFSFSAHSGPNGDFGQAQFRLTDQVGFLDVTTDVDCLIVFPFPPRGNGAWFSGLVTAVDDPSGMHLIARGDRILYLIFDGGNPSTGMVDLFDPREDPTGVVNCKALPTGDEYPNVTQGNIVITGN